ncbi:glycine dehydrogenase (aminomethyl-transferring), partial [candidate division KSB1 bacterium]|nr:glycine dehydrogenase (aminomethyl-transferring) [candidate division KSB1 bacterium]
MTVDRSFADRHIGPTVEDLSEMLSTVKVSSLTELIDQTIPSDIRIHTPLSGEGQSEQTYLDTIRQIARENQVYRSYIGLGYYGTLMPAVIQRNIFENPGWYTQYTPYQSEIAQGRLEALLNFQTLISDLTGLPIANASLLDEGTAAAEAMTLLHRLVNRSAADSRHAFFIDRQIFPQTRDVIIGRALPLGIEIVEGNYAKFVEEKRFFGALLQYPNQLGQVNDYRDFITSMHDAGIQVAVATDLLSLLMLTPPGEMGADVVVGSSQRFGVPIGFGGPHAAFFAARDEAIRQIPGRIIGVSQDSSGRTAFRMALQTREQHIRREKATSNICTAQALLAILAGMYATYHGPKGLLAIAQRVHGFARQLEKGLKNLGFNQCNKTYFDTLCIDTNNAETASRIHRLGQEIGINLRSIDAQRIGVSLDETVRTQDVNDLLSIFAGAVDQKTPALEQLSKHEQPIIPDALQRETPVLTHSIFNRFHSETQMLRYIKKLESRDLALTTSMIPLGSCTMKLNATTEMMPLSWPEFADIHPFAPADQSAGYRRLFTELSDALGEITGLPGVSLQPNSGAQG